MSFIKTNHFVSSTSSGVMIVVKNKFHIHFD
jgi:hypothetical protein